MRILGRHLIVELSGCDRARLNDRQLIEEYMMEAVRRSGATIVGSVFHRYNPHGVSGVVVIAESHISVHTWPEYGYAAVDFFTCGESVDPVRAHEYLRDMLAAGDVQVREVQRGMPSGRDEIVNHKPVKSDVAAIGG